jgi:hypothetical protein
LPSITLSIRSFVSVTLKLVINNSGKIVAWLHYVNTRSAWLHYVNTRSAWFHYVNDERKILDDSMAAMLPLLYQRITFMMQDQSEASVLLQKQILKIYYAFIQV